MNWKQVAAGAGAVAGTAAVGGLLAGRRGFESGAVIAAIGALFLDNAKPQYDTAAKVAAVGGLATAASAWATTPRGKNGFHKAMETTKSLSRRG